MDSDNKGKNNKQFSNNLKGGDLLNTTKFEYIQAIQAQPLEVKVYNNFDAAFKAFRALVQKERVLSKYKEKQFYEKPSDRKRRKRNEAQRKLLELNSKSFREFKDSKKPESEQVNSGNTGE